jgi:hypothetical protein
VRRTVSARTHEPALLDDAGGRRSKLRGIVLQLTPTARYLSIGTDDDRIERYVRASYPELLADGMPPAAADRGIIRTGSPPATVTFNGRPLPRPKPNERRSPWSSGAYIVDQFLWRSVARDAAWLSLYGCAVALNGRVVVIVGPSGAGKTTLGLALTRLGGRLYGDEMIVIHRTSGLVAVIARRLAVRERTLAILGDPRLSAIVGASYHVTSGPERTYYVGRDALDESFAPMPPPLPLGALVVLKRGEGPVAVRAVSPACAALAAAPYFGSRPGDLSEVAELVGVLRGAATLELTATEPRAAAACLVEALAP